MDEDVYSNETHTCRSLLMEEVVCCFEYITTRRLGVDAESRKAARARAKAIGENAVLRELFLPIISSPAAVYQIDMLLRAIRMREIIVQVPSSACQDAVVAAVWRAVRRDGELVRSLGIYVNGMTHSGVEMVADMLRRRACKLSRLFMNGTSVDGPLCGVSIANALRTNTSLRTLRLCRIFNPGNKVLFSKRGDLPWREDDIFCVAISTTLRTSNRTLKTLDLNNNNIGAEGAKALADMLKVNTTLKTLDIGNNSIGHDGATAIAEAMRVNRGLKSLNVRWNRITPEGRMALIVSVREHAYLERFSLAQFDPSDEEQAAMFWTVFVTSRLRYCNYTNNLFHDMFPQKDEMWALRGLRELRDPARGNVSFRNIPSSAVAHIASYIIPRRFSSTVVLYRELVERARRENIF